MTKDSARDDMVGDSVGTHHLVTESNDERALSNVDQGAANPE